MSLLRLAGVIKRFSADAPPAVDGLSLSVGAGEVLALLGPSGCGKTTTLRLVAGFEAPDAGVIEIRGEEVAGPGRAVPPESRGGPLDVPLQGTPAVPAGVHADGRSPLQVRGEWGEHGPQAPQPREGVAQAKQIQLDRWLELQACRDLE